MKEHEQKPNEYEVLSSIDLDNLGKELEALGFRWDLIEGSEDLIRNGQSQIIQSFNYYKDNPKEQKQVLSVVAESHIGRFTAPGRIEPIKKHSSVPYELSDFLAEKIFNLLSS